MIIDVTDISAPEQAGGSKNPYFKMAVQYQNADGRKGTKSLVSFPPYGDVFAFFKELDVPAKVEVKAQKDGNFWNWVAAELSDGTPASNPSYPRTQKGNEVKTWEPNKERQESIVRQSCLKSAIETLKVDKSAADPEEVLVLAEKYENWVNRTAKDKTGFDTLKDDIPE